MSLLPRAPVGSAFWHEQARRFSDLRQEAIRQSKRPLGANFHPDGWGFSSVRALRDRSVDRWYLDHGTPQIVEEFQSIAGLCAVARGASNSETAWVEWLDYLRSKSVDFTSGDFVVESRANGADEITSAELGEIDDVCAASERRCRQVADEALKDEIQGATLDSGRRSAAPEPGNRSGGWTVTQGWEAEFVPKGSIPQFPLSLSSAESSATSRKGVVEPLLAARGWSTLDWAKEARVDYNTASKYLSGVTTPRRDTLKKLAEALGLKPADLPA